MPDDKNKAEPMEPDAPEAKHDNLHSEPLDPEPTPVVKPQTEEELLEAADAEDDDKDAADDKPKSLSTAPAPSRSTQAAAAAPKPAAPPAQPFASKPVTDTKPGDKK